MSNKTYQQIIGTSYEYYVLENIKKDFEKVWHWSDFPEKLMYENKMINDLYQEDKLDIFYQ